MSGLIIAGLILGSTHLSKEKFLDIVFAQAKEVLDNNLDMMEEISLKLSSGKPEDFKRIAEICNFLSNQRKDLPNICIIYSGKFDEKLAIYQIGTYFRGDVEKGQFEHSYYVCTAGRDCDYLHDYFNDKKTNVEVLKHKELRSDEFSIYIPYQGKGKKFIILYSRVNRYGKIGS